MDSNRTQPFEPPAEPGVPTQPTVAGPVAPYSGGLPPARFDVPVAPVGRGRPRRSLWRYLVAAVIVALVVTGGIGATLLLTGSSGGASILAGYAPADSTLYAEGRLDLPGSQRAEVAKTLAALPGFADQAALSTKLGELLDRLLRAATNGKHDYQSEIAPWFAGQVAVAEGPQAALAGLTPSAGLSPAASPSISPTASLPACTGVEGDAPSPSPAGQSGTGPMALGIRALMLASVTDSQKAGAWVTSVLGDASVKTADRTCDGVVVHVVQTTESLARVLEFGWAVIGDKVLVAGDLDSIRLAIATKGTAGISAVTGFQKAVGSLQGDHVGLLYEAVRAMVKAQADNVARLGASGLNDGSEGAKAMVAVYSVLPDLMPEWIAGDLKASNGNVVVDVAQPRQDYEPSANRPSDVAGLAPSKTIALLDLHDLGKMAATIKDKFAADPNLAPYVKQLDTTLNLAGGFAGTVGWIGDAGFAVTRDGAKVSGGVIARPDDAAAAHRLVDELRALLALGGSSAGISVQDEQYKGVTISSVNLSSLAPAIQSGMGSSGMSVPADLQLVYAVTDKAVVLTLDKDFAKSVIDASQGGDSLAKDARFSSLLGQAGTKNAGVGWVDLTAVRELVEADLSATQRAKYDADVRPYLLPFDALVTVRLVDGDLARGTMILSINH